MKIKQRIEKYKKSTLIIIGGIIASILIFLITFINESTTLVGNLFSKPQKTEVSVYNFDLKNSYQTVLIDKSKLLGNENVPVLTVTMTSEGPKFIDLRKKVKGAKIECLSFNIELQVSNKKNQNYSFKDFELFLVGDSVENLGYVPYVGQEMYFIDRNFEFSNPSVVIQPNEIKIVRLSFIIAPVDDFEKFVREFLYKYIIIQYSNIENKKETITLMNPMKNTVRVSEKDVIDFLKRKTNIKDKMND
jgi:hypothetical protein